MCTIWHIALAHAHTERFNEWQKSSQPCESRANIYAQRARTQSSNANGTRARVHAHVSRGFVASVLHQTRKKNDHHYVLQLSLHTKTRKVKFCASVGAKLRGGLMCAETQPQLKGGPPDQLFLDNEGRSVVKTSTHTNPTKLQPEIQVKLHVVAFGKLNLENSILARSNFIQVIKFLFYFN